MNTRRQVVLDSIVDSLRTIQEGPEYWLSYKGIDLLPQNALTIENADLPRIGIVDLGKESVDVRDPNGTRYRWTIEIISVATSDDDSESSLVDLANALISDIRNWLDNTTPSEVISIAEEALESERLRENEATAIVRFTIRVLYYAEKGDN